MDLPREELQVTPSKDDDKVGWTSICYSGVEVYKKADCQDKDPKDWPSITKKDGLKVGDVVYTSVFGMLQEGTVCESKSLGLYVDAGPNMTDLNFDEDDRHCWTTACAFNKKAMTHVKLYH